jgi:hypothetical protein
MATLPAVLTWTQLLAALRSCAGDHVLIRDGRETKPAESVRNRPAASGTEYCLFSADAGISRLALIARLEALAKGTGRRFMSSAKANVNDANLLIDGAEDEAIDGVTYAVVMTRRPKLGYNRSESSAAPTSLGRSSKRIKTT